MKKISLLVLAVFLLVSLAACNEKSNSAASNNTSTKEVEKKVLTMGTSADFAPYESVDTTKSTEIIGFDVDVAKAIGKKLGYEIKVQDNDFNGLLTALQAGKFDFVMGAMEASAERKKNADFSVEYFTTELQLLVKKDGPIKKEADLKGKTMGLQVGSNNEKKAVELKKTIDFKIVNRDRIPDILQEMKANRVDATILGDVVAKEVIRVNPEFAVVLLPSLGAKGGINIAFAKGSPLTEKFNGAINELKKSGEMDQLVLKWFSN